MIETFNFEIVERKSNPPPGEQVLIHRQTTHYPYMGISPSGIVTYQSDDGPTSWYAMIHPHPVNW